MLAVPDGGYVRLRDVASVTRAAGPVEVIRKNQVKQVIVRADPAGGRSGDGADRDPRGARRGRLADRLCLDSSAARRQQMVEMQAVVRERAGTGAVLLVSGAGGTVQQPAPAAGGVSGRALLSGRHRLCAPGSRGQPFGATVIIGVMVVLATNVNDGVLLIETAERLRAEGMERIKATQRAAELRLRPRLMITLPVSLGFVPLAFALEPGGELLRPLAVAAIGGLLAAVLVALYLVPVLYTLVARRDDRLEHPSTTSIDNARARPIMAELFATE
ncbi:MAG: efflux RND transporter permease subunit [Chromatiales bacterium]|nr:efflux RND transporter permease subunit [Chromatiales bacterium]